MAIIAAPVPVRAPDTATELEPAFEKPASISWKTEAWSSAPGPMLGMDSSPFSVARAHISGQSGRSRSSSIRNQISQFTSVEASRPMAITSAGVQGSRAKPSTPCSWGSASTLAM